MFIIAYEIENFVCIMCLVATQIGIKEFFFYKIDTITFKFNIILMLYS